MIDDVGKRCEPAVVVEAAFVNLLGVEQRPQRRRYIRSLGPRLAWKLSMPISLPL